MRFVNVGARTVVDEPKHDPLPIRSEATRALGELTRGDRTACDRLFPLIYEELHALAEAAMRRERADHTLQATALVHEAYLRIVDDARVGEKGRSLFFAQAAITMRRILVDHARRKRSLKRGGAMRRVPVDEELELGPAGDALDLLALDDALTRLAALDPESAGVIEMRFFAGMLNEEIALALGTSTRTIERRWRFARAWLFRELEGGATGSAP